MYINCGQLDDQICTRGGLASDDQNRGHRPPRPGSPGPLEPRQPVPQGPRGGAAEVLVRGPRELVEEDVVVPAQEQPVADVPRVPPVPHGDDVRRLEPEDPTAEAESARGPGYETAATYL